MLSWNYWQGVLDVKNIREIKKNNRIFFENHRTLFKKSVR